MGVAKSAAWVHRRGGRWLLRSAASVSALAAAWLTVTVHPQALFAYSLHRITQRRGLSVDQLLGKRLEQKDIEAALRAEPGI
jgi:hypothetical protein